MHGTYNSLEAQDVQEGRWRLYLLALEMGVSAFDSDCTGDLDEGEVRALLVCLGVRMG
eukprot:CAMPEP_0173242698 /NCGR_PEP_ID=MMETSP1142-20121109/15089_1 /TAXON_ID=483371 /ORGANISM="non described non described, Strain CCMP2298" /LENGTH=57 /DNA_ID=CAMNT_0014174205 /DNA_START=342 /DNA_END=511 /DNA_ORIENTATION=+